MLKPLFARLVTSTTTTATTTMVCAPILYQQRERVGIKPKSEKIQKIRYPSTLW